MINIGIVIVLYKKHYRESMALRTLLNKIDEMKMSMASVNIFVWNNSPESSEPLQHESVIWLEGENVKLPLIYNHVANLAFEQACECLMLSDDDTDYSKYNFKENLEIVKTFIDDPKKNELTGCFIPRIRSGGRLVSPGARHLFRGYLLKQPPQGLVSSKNLLAINSGTIITKACYDRMQPLYDDRLHFYGTDTDFFVRYENHYANIYVLESEIDHSLSEDSLETLDRLLFRWHDNLRAMEVIFEKQSFFFKIAMRTYYVLLRLKLFIKFRDKRFLQI